MSIVSKLIAVQQGLKVPKKHYNEFGGFHYRSLEDIVEAAKPLLNEQGLALVLHDEIVQIGDRFYVKATATLFDAESSETISAYGFARETDKRAKMDDAQVTGSASSYARKYALCGLLSIDGQDDADQQNGANGSAQNTRQTQQPAQQPQQQEQGSQNIVQVVVGRPENFVQVGNMGFRTAQFPDKKIGWIMADDPALVEQLAALKGGIMQKVIGTIVPESDKVQFPKDMQGERVMRITKIAKHSS